MSLSKPDCQSLDDIVDAFETAWQYGPPLISEYWPDSGHVDFEEIVTELICVDLEWRRRSGNEKRLGVYQKEFPDLLADSTVLARIAFEEYRLLAGSADCPTPEEYATNFGIVTRDWPRHEQPQAPTLVSTSLPRVGQDFLSFELVDELSDCKVGGVFLARQKDLSNRTVVLKVTTDLWAESDCLARLQHTNIVPIYSVHQVHGLQAVCMPFLGKHTLSDVIKACGTNELSGRFAVELICPDRTVITAPELNLHLDQLANHSAESLCTWLMANIAAGLAHAHDRGILHRDLKPANILLTDELQAMVLDFDLSESTTGSLPTSKVVGGTLAYMAPEQLLATVAAGDVDRRSDIYSLGVILFELLTGKRPFATPPDSLLGAMTHLLSERKEVPRLRELKPDLSADIESIVCKCLADDPEERYQSAHALHEDLDRHLQHRPLRFASNRSVRLRISKWIKRHPTLTSASAIMTAAAIGIVFLATLFAWRSYQIQQIHETEKLREFELAVRNARTPLGSWISDSEMIARGITNAMQTLDVYGANRSDWYLDESLAKLSIERREKLVMLVTDLQYLIASTLRRQADTLPASTQAAALRKARRYNELSRDPTPSEDSVSIAQVRQRAQIEAALGFEDRAASLHAQADAMPEDGDFRSQLQMVIFELQENRFADVDEILAGLEAEQPRNFEVRFWQGISHYRRRDFVAANESFTHCVAIDPDIPYGYFFRGICRLDHGRYSDAEADFTAMLAKQQLEPNAYFNRALARIGLGAAAGNQEEALNYYGDAVSDLTRAVDISPQCNFLLQRARVYELCGKKKEALADRRAADRAEPVSFNGWLQRGNERHATDPDGALSDYNQALRLQPSHLTLLQNKAAVLSQLKRLDDAADVLSKAIRIRPTLVAAYTSRGLIYAKLGEKKKALDDGLFAIQLSDTPEVHFEMARIRAVIGRDHDKSGRSVAVHLKKALAKDPSLADKVEQDADLRLVMHRPAINQLISAAWDLLDE